MVLGCSGDTVETMVQFKAKHKLNFQLVSDPEFEAIESYHARRMKTFLGKSFLGIVRLTFWIGPDGRIREIWENVNPKGHAADVLQTVTQS